MFLYITTNQGLKQNNSGEDIVRPHAFFLGFGYSAKWPVIVLARNQVFPAIVFSAVSFFLVSFS